MELAYKIFIFPSFNIDNVFKYKPSAKWIEIH